jgi:ATP-dependent Lon protease
MALAGGLLEKHTKGGLVVVGQLNLGGSVELIPNPVAVAEIAAEKRAQILLMPVATRRQLNDLPDAIWTKLRIEFYADPVDAVFKALAE